MPCPAHRIIHNAIHAYTDWLFRDAAIWQAYKPQRAVACTDLRQLLDFDELCRFRSDGLDWIGVLAEVDRFGYKPELQQSAHIAVDLLGVSLPAGVAAWDVSRPETRGFRGLRGRSRRGASRALRAMGLQETARSLRGRFVSFVSRAA